jgi:hypothetical protein
MGKNVFLRCSKIYIERERERRRDNKTLLSAHGTTKKKISQSIKLEFDEK